MQLLGIDAHITCDGKVLEEYQTIRLDKTVIRCDICSEAGKEFVIHFNETSESTKFYPSRNGIILDFYSDGNPFKSFGISRFSSIKVSDVQTSTNTRSKLQFAPLQLLDVSEEETNVDLNSLGTIEVRVSPATRQEELVSRKKWKRIKAKMDADDRVSQKMASNIVSEKSKKAGLNTVSFGAPYKIDDDRSSSDDSNDQVSSKVKVKDVSFRYSLKTDRPTGTMKFLFRHRPRAVLEVAGVLPASSQSSNVESLSSQPGEKRVRSQSLEDSGPSQSGKRRRHSKPAVEASSGTYASLDANGADSESQAKIESDSDDRTYPLSPTIGAEAMLEAEIEAKTVQLAALRARKP